MRNKIFLIVFAVCFILCVSGITVFAYLTFRDDMDMIVFIMIIQNMAFAGLALVALIYIASSKKEPRNPDDASIPYVSKLLAIKGAGEINLKNKKSLVIGKRANGSGGGLAYAITGGSLEHEYAVLNSEKNYWYIEAFSEAHAIGIRREHDGVFRVLNVGKPYLLGKNDIIEIEGEQVIAR